MFKGATKPVLNESMTTAILERTAADRPNLMRPGLQFRSDETSSPTARPLAIRAGGLDVGYQGAAGVHKVLASLDIEVAEFLGVPDDHRPFRLRKVQRCCGSSPTCSIRPRG